MIKDALIDAGPLVAFYDRGDDWYGAACDFFGQYRGRLHTTEAVCTEVMYLLDSDWRVQNQFLRDLQKGIFLLEVLLPADLELIAQLNEKYSDLPHEFADLSIVAVARRLNLIHVVSLDSDFNVYRSHGGKAFKQIFPKWK